MTHDRISPYDDADICPEYSTTHDGIYCATQYPLRDINANIIFIRIKITTCHKLIFKQDIRQQITARSPGDTANHRQNQSFAEKKEVKTLDNDALRRTISDVR